MFGTVAGKRCASELCGGAGGVPDPAEPGPGRGDGGICIGTGAPPWSDLRRGVFVGAGGAHTDLCQFCDTGSSLRGADDCVHGGIAGRGQSEDGGVAGANGFDPGDGGGQSVAGGVQPLASHFGFAGKRRAFGGIRCYLFDGKRVNVSQKLSNGG